MDNETKEKLKEQRLFSEELQRQLEKANKKIVELEKPKIEEPKKFIDIPFDAWRKIENLWLGNIKGVSKARAYRATSAQTITTGTNTKVELNAESYDTQDEFDSTTNFRFTAKKAGYYQVNAVLFYLSPIDGQYVRAYLYKNGTRVALNLAHVGSTNNISAVISDIIYLAAGDYLELWTVHNAGVDKNIHFGSDFTYMSIHKLS